MNTKALDTLLKVADKRKLQHFTDEQMLLRGTPNLLNKDIKRILANLDKKDVQYLFDSLSGDKDIKKSAVKVKKVNAKK